MDNSKISIGIVGAGRMGITHYSILNSHPDIQITAVADPSSLVLTLMEKYLAVKTFKDSQDLITKGRPNAILVCTPPHLHYDILKEAGKNGIHAFVEKPFTTTYTHSAIIRDLYEQKGLVNQVGYVNRFNDVFSYVKQLIDNQVIGKVVRFKSEMFSCTVTKPEEHSGWRSSHDTGGGVVFEMASHAIDLVNYLIGPPAKVIGTCFDQVYSSSVEDIVSSTFVYPDIHGSLFVNWSDASYRKPSNKIELFSRQGKIIADQYAAKIFLGEENQQYGLRKGWNTKYITDVAENVPFYVRGNEFTSQLYHFVECIKNNKISRCSFRDASLTQEVIEKMFQDGKQNALS